MVDCGQVMEYRKQETVGRKARKLIVDWPHCLFFELDKKTVKNRNTARNS